MLKHVRQPGLPKRILHRTGIDMHEERKHRRLGPLADHDGQSVRKLFDRGALLERSNILRASQRGEKQNNGKRLQRTAVHWTSMRLDVNEGQKFEITWRKGKLSNGNASGIQSSIRECLLH